KAQDMAAFQLLKKSKMMSEGSRFLEGAKQHCFNCLSIYPDHENCWNNLGTIYFGLNDLDRATICFQRSIALNDEAADPFYNRGNIYLRKEKYSDACYFYEEAIR